MIHDVDEGLRELVRREAVDGARVEIAFDAPTKDWVARRNAPTLDLYLYDIREDLQRREVAWEPVRGADGIVTERRAPDRRYRLSYLVTAWTQRPEDEHRLLSAALACFIRNPLIPEDLLPDDLGAPGRLVLVTVALPPPQDRSLADVWSALGGELKPSLDVVVSAPIDAERRIDAAPPVREDPRIRVVRPDGATETPESGRGRRTGPGRPLPDGDPAQEELLRPGAEGIAVGTAVQPPAAGNKGSDIAADKVPGRHIVIRGFPRR